jgi:hypothetical protein
MQIPITGTNAAASAALPLQNSDSNKGEKAASNQSPPSNKAADQVQKSEQSQDRDANEQYSDQNQSNRKQENLPAKSDTAAANSLDELTVVDPEPSQIDLKG